MDPAIIFFGVGIGMLVGMTGMGGGSLMTPLLIFIFGISPTTAIGTDIFYSAVTKTVGAGRHFRMKTVNLGLTVWLAAGSVPAAILGVFVISILKDHLGEDQHRGHQRSTTHTGHAHEHADPQSEEDDCRVHLSLSRVRRSRFQTFSTA